MYRVFYVLENQMIWFWGRGYEAKMVTKNTENHLTQDIETNKSSGRSVNRKTLA